MVTNAIQNKIILIWPVLSLVDLIESKSSFAGGTNKSDVIENDEDSPELHSQIVSSKVVFGETLQASRFQVFSF